ncbi:hypothetical protein QQF64_012702 [Cirrhinus molitorella]|uniref:Uncharacterized protein n=1 Tax=Cirrhinus molitorella TaxID=172907 RepID=A0ABR3LZV4_9TELE
MCKSAAVWSVLEERPHNTSSAASTSTRYDVTDAWSLLEIVLGQTNMSQAITVTLEDELNTEAYARPRLSCSVEGLSSDQLIPSTADR